LAAEALSNKHLQNRALEQPQEPIAYYDSGFCQDSTRTTAGKETGRRSACLVIDDHRYGARYYRWCFCLRLALFVRQRALTESSNASSSGLGLYRQEPSQQAQAVTESAQALDSELKLEFYTELQKYEVLVDATPVDLSYQDPERELDKDYVCKPVLSNDANWRKPKCTDRKTWG
jgi:hypothetical protein